MEFNYYYGSQADQFSFIRIPKVMLTEETFSSLSIPAKVLYGVLLDRMTLSRKNAWFDEENRVLQKWTSCAVSFLCIVLLSYWCVG